MMVWKKRGEGKEKERKDNKFKVPFNNYLGAGYRIFAREEEGEREKQEKIYKKVLRT
jgi:hypothetical protein